MCIRWFFHRESAPDLSSPHCCGYFLFCSTAPRGIGAVLYFEKPSNGQSDSFSFLSVQGGSHGFSFFLIYSSLLRQLLFSSLLFPIQHLLPFHFFLISYKTRKLIWDGRLRQVCFHKCVSPRSKSLHNQTATYDFPWPRGMPKELGAKLQIAQ